MTNEILDQMVKKGTIASYKLVEVSENGEEGVTGKFRNTERLTIDFINGEKLVIDTCCSGCSENTILSFS